MLKTFKSIVLKTILYPAKMYNQMQVAKIPVFDFSEIHLKHLVVLPDRKTLLHRLPKHGIVAELGVDTGAFSSEILSLTNPEKLHLIDVWSTKRYNREKKNHVFNKFSEEITVGTVEINIGLSTESVHNFPDAYFDWIYIDTDHTYKTTYEELCLYSKKIKPGGIIAGHDFVTGNWNGLIRYGVIEAVAQFCVTQGWELIYLTLENTESKSFAIRKI